MKLNIEKITDEELQKISSSVSIRKEDIYGIAARCVHGFPQVVVLNPVKDASSGELNPDALDNILWLTCPAIYSKITSRISVMNCVDGEFLVLRAALQGWFP